MTSNIEGRDVHNAYWHDVEPYGSMEIFVVKIFGLVHTFSFCPMVAGIGVVRSAACGFVLGRFRVQIWVTWLPILPVGFSYLFVTSLGSFE